MLFSDGPRRHYRRPPVHEAICQLRFPPILSINRREPADFQERVREEFPQYARKQDHPPAGRADPLLPVTNHHFLSRDGKWKINLTRDFIALSTLSYPGWEPFARTLDKLLAAFIEIYRPDEFKRVGLRYLNIFSRKALDLEDRAWRELVIPVYLGPLADAEAETRTGPGQVVACGVDVQMDLSASCGVKIHAGLGKLKVPSQTASRDDEVKFLFDMDLAMRGPVAGPLAPPGLETLHGHGTALFEGAMTDTLRQALQEV